MPQTAGGEIISGSDKNATTSRLSWHAPAEEAYEGLRRSRDHLALVRGPRANEVVSQWAELHGTMAVSVGQRLTQVDSAVRNPASALCGSPFLIHLDVLFWPDLNVDPLDLLRELARREPVIAAWPGEISKGRASYSQPGRRDYYETPLPEVVVFGTKQTIFPDEVAFEVEECR